jgi:lipopolysaccharide export system permease protein
MILTAIWERYLFKEVIKVFFLFLGCFFFLYALIDYSLHMQDFIADKEIHLTHLLCYYSFQFVKRADLLIPLALLIATIKVLFAINAKGELVALQASGIPLKRLMRPFFIAATLCALFNFLSAEFFLPSSLNFLDKFRELHFKHSYRGHRKEPIHILPLKDGSKLIYQSEDKDKNSFFDVFWVRSIDDLWRMKMLSADPDNPVGKYVDHLKRTLDGNLEKVESFETYRFGNFKWQPDLSGKGMIPLENRKMTELLRLLKEKRKTTAFEYPQVLTHLLFKCTIPLLSFLVIIGAAPFCIRYSRNLLVFFTYAVALFSFVAFFAFMDAAVILGENHVLSPFTAILLPILLLFFGFSFKYRKTIGRLS